MPVDTTSMIDYHYSIESYRYCRDLIKNLKKCKNYYLGVTSDPENRLQEHTRETQNFLIKMI